MEKIDAFPIARLALIVKAELVPIFFQLLGQGFKVNVQIGCSLKELLCNQLGINEDYLTERIKTIFLNAKVVDDVKSANITEGSVLALSGAMPGLAGAILRSGGIYAGMRSQISHDQNQSSLPVGAAKITLKLLNLIAKELGPSFLQNGVLINRKKLQEFTESHWQALRAGCISINVDDTPVDINSLRQIDWDTDLVVLQVNSEPAG